MGAGNSLKLECDVEHPVEAPVLDLFQAGLDEFPDAMQCRCPPPIEIDRTAGLPDPRGEWRT